MWTPRQGTKTMDESTPRGIGFTSQWRWEVLNQSFFLYYFLTTFKDIVGTLGHRTKVNESDKFVFQTKKKKGDHSEIWLWRDEASFCGEMIGSECWPETLIWRRDGAIADSSSFSIVQMFSTIASINSDSRLQMQAKPQLVFLKNRVSVINWSYNKEEMSYGKWIEMPNI